MTGSFEGVEQGHTPDHSVTPCDVESLASFGTSTHFELATLTAIKANEVACLCDVASACLTELGSQSGSANFITLAQVVWVARNLAAALSLEGSTTVDRLSESQDGVA